MAVRVGFLVLILAALWGASRYWAGSHPKAAATGQKVNEVAMAPEPLGKTPSLPKTDEEWRSVLTPEQYEVTRQKGTEAPFSGEYYKTDKQGVYRCVCCGEPLFSSDTKFDAHCGWPSFWKPLGDDRIKTLDDHSHAMHRTEVQCRKCGAHLGHVFDDGPRPTGLRYCINSVSLKLEAKKSSPEAAKPDAPSK
jgi:peptide-methionine (R)-S-oxide reductase